jgi:hypothetical protein
MSTLNHPWDYEDVAASQTAQVLGPGTATTKQGDFLSHLICTPATASPGAISIKDGSDTAYEIFPGGASSVSSLKPFHIIVASLSRTGSWQVTTGLNIKVRAIGRFT